MTRKNKAVGARPRRSRVGLILKVAIFATGCAGIVAEFVLSTLATYLLGDAVFQWTVVMSLMLFAMGLGSRFSRRFGRNLLDAFILIEFTLSLLCASSSVIAYGLAGRVANLNLLIYSLALGIGLLIGLEIPLVTRINQAYEELKTNIAGVMEKDYYGALLGGLFFAFFALPRLGLTYTPIILGAINFLVASLLLVLFHRLVRFRLTTAVACLLSTAALIALAFLAEPIVMHGEQSRYRDKVVLVKQTAYQKIVITQWRDDYWLFINDQEQFSTLDEERYHEPLVHPALSLAADKGRVLILGGGDGLALREVLKHPGVEAVVLVDLDPAMTTLAAELPVLKDINRGSMSDRRVRVVNQDAAAFLEGDDGLYGTVIIDLPDPDSSDLMHLYSEGFYRLVKSHLAPGGVMVTQAASPFFAPKAFLCILKTIQAAGLTCLPYHNQVPTMGEWGFVLGVRAEEMNPPELKRRVLSLDFWGLETRFLNPEAMISMVHFGKGVLEPEELAKVQVNTSLKPVLFKYYRQGKWEAY